MKDLKENCMLVALVVVVALATLSCIWVAAMNESSVYNKRCGGNMTTWDAVWVELRVTQECKG